MPAVRTRKVLGRHGVHRLQIMPRPHRHTVPGDLCQRLLVHSGLRTRSPIETPTQFATTGQDVHAESGRSILLTNQPIQLSVGKTIVVDRVQRFIRSGSLNNTLVHTPGPDIVTQDIDYTAMTTITLTLLLPASISATSRPNPYGVAVEVVSNEPYCTQCPAGKFKNVTENSQCSSCAPGKFQSEVGMSVCEDFPPLPVRTRLHLLHLQPGLPRPNFPWPYPEMCGDTPGFVLAHDNLTFMT